MTVVFLLRCPLSCVFQISEVMSQSKCSWRITCKYFAFDRRKNGTTLSTRSWEAVWLIKQHKPACSVTPRGDWHNTRSLTLIDRLKLIKTINRCVPHALNSRTIAWELTMRKNAVLTTHKLNVTVRIQWASFQRNYSFIDAPIKGIVRHHSAIG